MAHGTCLQRDPWIDEAAINIIQVSAVGCVLLFASGDLFFRKPQNYPERQRREVHYNVKRLLPSLVWRWLNFATCSLWIGFEFSSAIADYEDLAMTRGTESLACSQPKRTAEDLRQIRILFIILLASNGVLCLWAWQYYHGVHAIYRSHLRQQDSSQTNSTVNARFFAACPPEAYLSELQGIELILGAADTFLVNMPVFIFSMSFSSAIPGGMGPFGHANLFISVATYILNLWLASDRAPGLDAYRLQFGGWRSPCPCNGTRLGEFLFYLLAFPVCWLNTGIVAVPAAALVVTGFNPRVMRLNWFLPRFSHHRTPGFGHNDAVAQVLEAKRFPGVCPLPQLDVAAMPTEGGMDSRWGPSVRPGQVRADIACGFTDDQIKQFPLKAVETGSDRVCCICLDRVVTGEVVLAFSCPHIQHRQCVEPWLKRRSQCPECRTPLRVTDPRVEGPAVSTDDNVGDNLSRAPQPISLGNPL